MRGIVSTTILALLLGVSAGSVARAAEIAVEGGRLELAAVRLPWRNGKARVVEPAGAKVQAAAGEATVSLSAALGKGERLRIVLE